jgi:hypothetical protein
VTNAWTWEATATIIQAVATVVALVGVAITFIFSARSEKRDREKAHADAEAQRQEAERAAASAERSERAAALSIDTLARIATAIERMAAPTVANVTHSIVTPSKVRWSLVRTGEHGYRLTNVGNATAYAVTITAHETLLMVGLPDAPQTLHADEAVAFSAFRGLGTRDSTITVSWAVADEPDAPREQWRYPLP